VDDQHEPQIVRPRPCQASQQPVNATDRREWATRARLSTGTPWGEAMELGGQEGHPDVPWGEAMRPWEEAMRLRVFPWGEAIKDY
jgi:hypothetical protein